jgi:hypothetical protein
VTPVGVILSPPIADEGSGFQKVRIMWLPKDERTLLSYHYRQINRVETGQKFEIRELIKALGKKEQSGPPKTKREIILDTYNTLESVHY